MKAKCMKMQTWGNAGGSVIGTHSTEPSLIVPYRRSRPISPPQREAPYHQRIWINWWVWAALVVYCHHHWTCWLLMKYVGQHLSKRGSQTFLASVTVAGRPIKSRCWAPSLKFLILYAWGGAWPCVLLLSPLVTLIMMEQGLYIENYCFGENSSIWQDQGESRQGLNLTLHYTRVIKYMGFAIRMAWVWSQLLHIQTGDVA